MRRRITDHSGTTTKRNLPEVPELDLVFYHWSPSTNRASINRLGLDIHRKTLQGEWRPPYVAFSDEPDLAWTLSGKMYPGIKSWDLWMCDVRSQTSFDHYEICLDTYRVSGKHYVKEYRVYKRIYKRDLIYIATRIQGE